MRRLDARQAISANLQAHNLNLETRLCSNFALKSVKGLAAEFHNTATATACQMNVLAIRPNLVIVLLACQVHQVQLVHQLELFQKLQRPIHGRPIDARITLASQLQKCCGIQMLRCFLNCLNQRLPLRSKTETFLGYCVEQRTSFGLFFTHNCDGVATSDEFISCDDVAVTY